MGNGLVANKQSRITKDASDMRQKANVQNKDGPASRQLARKQQDRISYEGNGGKSNANQLHSPFKEAIVDTKVTRGAFETKSAVETTLTVDTKKLPFKEAIVDTKVARGAFETKSAAETTFTGETKSAAETKLTVEVISTAETKSMAEPQATAERPENNDDIRFNQDISYTVKLHRCNTEPQRSRARWKPNNDGPTTPPGRDSAQRTTSEEPPSPMKSKYQISKLIVKRANTFSDPHRQRGKYNRSIGDSECAHVGCGSTCRYSVSRVRSCVRGLQLRRKRNSSLVYIAI